ncbi:nucleotidyltransferase domain-containing protein [Streptomyces sp. NPDC020755]|uniref:nucleotidyltransferase domain-containing protein n=1 Tax=unclassified Streptomyces TaxID=2593676 RepID=UPI0022420A0B|nr:nucleotidyltransferase domain-containing protein [Streptomyces sp. VB1]UZI30777.1 nucleotidyltransferase domain-containing protein [Streptomyces sp. VB1]
MPHTPPAHAREARPPLPAGAPALARRVALLRTTAEADPRVEGVLLYGSWTLGEADAHSDLDACLYVREEDVDSFDGREFVERLAPLKLAYTNMYGILAVVFDDLMRGEFHVEPTGPGIAEIRTWRGQVHFPRPEAAVLLDRTGDLTAAARELAASRPPEPVATAQQLTDELANWTLMLAHVQARGEYARAHNLLHAVIAPLQLKLCRLLHGSTTHWLTPSRALEVDLPSADVERYATTTGPLTLESLRTAAANSWRWSRELAAGAADRWGTRLPLGLHEEIAEALAPAE